MNLDELKNEARSLIGRDEMPEALELLMKWLDETSELYDAIITIKSRSNRIEKGLMLGSISYEKAEPTLSEISFRLLQFVKQLHKSDLKTGIKSGTSHAKIEDKIIFISNTTDEEIIKGYNRFFSRLKFNNVEVVFLDEYRQFEGVEVIIFDNTDLAYCPKPEMANEAIRNRVSLMEEFMKKNEELFFIHYGEVLYWLNDKEIRKRFHPANSRFSLYARVKEMLDFLATITAK